MNQGEVWSGTDRRKGRQTPPDRGRPAGGFRPRVGPPIGSHRTWLAAVTGLLLLVAWASQSLSAQRDELLRTALQLKNYEVYYWYERLVPFHTPDFNLNKIVATGGFSIVARPGGKPLLLRCDSAVVWLDPKARFRPRKGEKPGKTDEPRPFYEDVDREGAFLDYRALLGIYAEGDVYFQIGQSVLRARKIYFDPVLNRVVVVHGYVSTVLAGGRSMPDIPFHARAEELRIYLERLGPDPQAFSASLVKLRARNVDVSSCDFGIPHYHIHASDIRVDPHQDDDAYVAIHDATLNVLGVPSFYLPYLGGPTALLDYFPLRSVSAGSDRRFGTFIYTTWGDEIRLRDRDGRFRKWGSWELDLDSRTRRGLGGGLTLDYRTDTYFGLMTGYYTRDKGTDLSRDWPIDPPNDRGRFRAFHRQFLPGGLQLDAEAAWIRDPNFLYEYFENEARTGKIQENYVRLMRDWNNLTGRLIYRPRVNDFYTRTEYLPRLSGEVFSQPLVPGGFLDTNAYAGVRAEAMHGGVRYEDALNLPHHYVDRAGAESELDVPVRLGPLHLDPFIQGSYTAWSRRAANDDPIGRSAFATGFRAHTQFWRTYEKGFFGMDLRHLVQPQILYTNTFEVSRPPRDLIWIDETELVDRFEAVTARLQTRLQVKPGKDVIDILEWDNEMVFYPDEDRDNNGRAEGPLFSRLKVGVAPVLFLADGLWSWESDALEVGNLGFLTLLGSIPGLPRSGATVYLGHRYARRYSDALTGALRARLGPKWSVQALFQYDFDNDRVMDQRYVLGRTFHRFRLEIEWYDDGGDGDHGFRFRFAPLEFFGRIERERERLTRGVFLGDY